LLERGHTRSNAVKRKLQIKKMTRAADFFRDWPAGMKSLNMIDYLYSIPDSFIIGPITQTKVIPVFMMHY
jgi:hypothetical protein